MSAYRCDPVTGATGANPEPRDKLLHSPCVLEGGLVLGDQRQRLRTLLRANELQPARPVFTITLGRDGTGTKLVRSFADGDSEGGALSRTNPIPTTILPDA